MHKTLVSYQLNYHPRAVKFLKKSTKKEQIRIIQKIEKFREDPNTSSIDIKKLVNTKRSYQIRIGTVRIIIEIENSTIYVQDIDYRGSIY